MSLYDFDNKRQYTKYKRHVNDSTERIDASTVNKLQQDICLVQPTDTKTDIYYVYLNPMEVAEVG